MTRRFANVLFDSGDVLSDESAHYVPDALPLTSAHRYYWQVRVRDNHARESGWSEPATFVTALLGERAWRASFISAETEADAENSRATRVFAPLNVTKPVRTAYAFTTALGLYHFTSTARRLEDQLAPGWTSYRKRLLYQTYDISALLRPGENEVSAWLGAGWYKGEMGFLHNRNNYGRRTAFLCQIEIEYEDGSRETFVSDASWQGEDTPVVFSEIYHGETYDARLPYANRRPVAVVPYEMGNLEAQSGCRVRVMNTLPVQRIIKTPRGETVLDFGQNLTGFVRFSVTGRAGDEVVLRCFEVLDCAGNVYTENLRTARQMIRYVLKGGGARGLSAAFHLPGLPLHARRFPPRRTGGGELSGAGRPLRYGADCGVCLVKRGAQPTVSQHSLGAQGQLPGRPDRLPAARRTAGLDGRRADLLPDGLFFDEYLCVFPQVAARPGG